MTERTGQAHDQLFSRYLDTCLAALDGRLEEALEIARSMLDRAEELGLAEYVLLLAVLAVSRPQLHLGGDLEGLEIEFQGALQGPARAWAVAPLLSLVLAHIERDSEVSEMLAQWVLARPGIGSAEDETPAWVDILFLEASVLMRHREAAGLLLRRLAGSGVHTSGAWCTTCTARHMGAAEHQLPQTGVFVQTVSQVTANPLDLWLSANPVRVPKSPSG